MRVPLGMRLRPEDVAGEKSQIHLAAYIDSADGPPIGCLLLKPLGDGTSQLRQMAVDAKHQRKGVGTQLVEAAIEWCRERGQSRIVLDARSEAESFYHRMGFRPEGPRRQIIGLDHVAMIFDVGPPEHAAAAKSNPWPPPGANDAIESN